MKGDTVYVIGHKNPDADAVCSAFAYAKLKSIIDKDNTYIAARCGRLNRQTRFVFEKADQSPPVFVSDVYPKVKDVMTEDVIYVRETEPLFYAIRNIETKNIRLVPVVDSKRELKGIISVFEIAHFFIGRDIETKPLYRFISDNCVNILNGAYYKRANIIEFEATIVVGAMPFYRFKEYLDRYDARRVVVVVGKRNKIINYSIGKDVAALFLTGIANISELENVDSSKYSGHIILSGFDSAETVRRLVLSVPVRTVMKVSYKSINENDHLQQAKERLSQSDIRALPVLDDNGRLIGILTRSDIIKRYARKVILMDHNEFPQAVDGIETAQIMEIIDHHRLGTVKTKTPINFYAKPVGSTSTLVYQLYEGNKIEPDTSTALILLSGILSDTVILKSPTTTREDVDAARKLANIAGVDVFEYGKEMFSNTDSLKTKALKDIVGGDFKRYYEFGVKLGIGQVEVVNLEELNQRKEEILDELSRMSARIGLDWAMLLVTDIVREDSVLLTNGYECEKDLPYEIIGNREYYLPGVLSRKKQLLPVVLGILEKCSQESLGL